MQSVSSPMDSKEMAVATMRAWGFFSNTRVRIPRRLPPLPPINTWVGAGSASQTSGASPETTVRFSAESAFLFSSSSFRAVSFRSMAYTQPRFACNAISMATEPVPAPTSQQTAFSVSCSLESATARTSLFVMGTFSSRRKTTSGNPWVTTASGASFSISATLRLS